MVLVDTSIWVSHFRGGEPRLKELLMNGRVVCHPFIVGELACGQLKNRKEILSSLAALPMAKIAEHEEVLHFIEKHRLIGIGLGYVDMHLLASALLSGIPLWTNDKKLKEVTIRLKISYR